VTFTDQREGGRRKRGETFGRPGCVSHQKLGVAPKVRKQPPVSYEEAQCKNGHLSDGLGGEGTVLESNTRRGHTLHTTENEEGRKSDHGMEKQRSSGNQHLPKPGEYGRKTHQKKSIPSLEMKGIP